MADRWQIGDRVQVTFCVNFPDLNGRIGTVRRANHYHDGTVEYNIQFSDEPGDWDWVKERELKQAK